MPYQAAAWFSPIPLSVLTLALIFDLWESPPIFFLPRSFDSPLQFSATCQCHVTRSSPQLWRQACHVVASASCTTDNRRPAYSLCSGHFTPALEWKSVLVDYHDITPSMVCCQNTRSDNTPSTSKYPILFEMSQSPTQPSLCYPGDAG